MLAIRRRLSREPLHPVAFPTSPDNDAAMAKNLCPSCERANALSARFCSACGTVLRVRCPQCAAQNLATRSTCAECGATMKAAPAPAPRARRSVPPASGTPVAPGGPAPGAVPAKRTSARRSAAAPPTAADLKLVLLDVDGLAPDARKFDPSKPELVRSDPEPQPPARAWADDGRAAARHGTAAPSATDAKAAHRAAVRRAVNARTPTPPTTAPTQTDVMVFDEDDAARAALCELLGDFGFDAVPARSQAEVARLLRLGPFAAVFLQVVLDGSGSDDAAQLCRLVKQQPNADVREAVLVVVANAARAVDRVRAMMAGADDFIVKPLNRGAIARALEACGVVLPADPRR